MRISVFDPERSYRLLTLTRREIRFLRRVTDLVCEAMRSSHQRDLPLCLLVGPTTQVVTNQSRRGAQHQQRGSQTARGKMIHTRTAKLRLYDPPAVLVFDMKLRECRRKLYCGSS